MVPTLEDDYRSTQAQVGHYLGFGRGPHSKLPEYTARQSGDLEESLRTGLKRFYAAHEWTFLKPEAKIQIDSGQRYVFLPDDWGGKDGVVSVTSAQGTIIGPVRWMNPAAVYQAYADFPSATGRPDMVCEVPVRDPVKGQRFQVQVWPTADATYYLNFPYYIVPDALEVNRPYAYGGAAHALTRTAACLAAAELRIDGVAGVMEQDYQMRLAESIRIDRRSEPRVLGYNGTATRGPFYRGNSAHRSGRTTLHVAGQTFN